MKWIGGCFIILISLIYCEFLADYVVLRQCDWPKSENPSALKAIVLADTHMLGPVRGHFLDKFYREWHMRGAFQAAMQLFQPNLVFILGDLFDEGDLVSNEQFDDYISRFHRYFHTPVGVPVITAVGNHDVGFHYRLHPYFTERFEKNFNNTGVNLYSFQGVHFVLINSMAMENDKCHFCLEAMSDLNRIASDLNCLKKGQECPKKQLLKDHGLYSRPILMQHFPTYRVSDKVCTESDAPYIESFRENWEVLSKESTDMLGRLLHPRLAFAGHSHHYCLQHRNRLGIEEHTVASFSWRNKINPSFLLATFSPDDYQVSKCDMLQQQTVYNIYLASFLMFLSIELILFIKYINYHYRLRHSRRVTKMQ